MRIFVYGPPGAGKSTTAFALGDRLGLPVLHLDRFFFRGPDVHLGDEEGLTALRAALPRGRWIVEGNHGAALEPIAREADHVLILDVPPLVCAGRILRRRMVGQARLRRAVPDGWEERVSAPFLWFALRRFPKGFGREVARIEAAAPGRVHRVAGRSSLAARPDVLRLLETGTRMSAEGKGASAPLEPDRGSGPRRGTTSPAP